jgi:hypothetical protein
LRQIRNRELAVGLLSGALMIAVAQDAIDARPARWFVALLALPDIRHKHVLCSSACEGAFVTGSTLKRAVHVMAEAAVAKPTVGNLRQRVRRKTVWLPSHRVIMTIPAATALLEQQILGGGKLLIDPRPLTLRQRRWMTLSG